MKKKALFILTAVFAAFAVAACGSKSEESSSSQSSVESSTSEINSSSSSSQAHQHTFTHADALDATCTAAGHIAYDYCAGCGKYFNAQGQEITLEQTVIAAKGHNYGAWTVTTQATCTTDGVETRVCANDATHTETRTISATGHNYGAWTVTTPATCTTDGVETRVCANDATHVETRTIAATGHNFGDWRVTTPATCTTDGVETRVCANDATHVETRTIAATGHNYGDWTIYAQPTCEEAGEERQVCANDATHIVSRPYGEPTGHVWGNWVTTTEPTCTTSGIQTRTCVNDATHKQTRTTDALGHDLVLDTEHPFTWDLDNKTAKANLVCQRQGCDHTEQVSAQISVNVVSSKTCTEAQKIKYTASYEGTSEFKLFDGEPATDHDYQFSEFVWNDANKTAKAKYVCTHDGRHTVEYDAEISSPVLKQAATCEKDAIYTYTASYDGHQASKDYVSPDTALGHDYSVFKGYEWAVDYSSAQAVFACSHDQNHEQRYASTVDSENVPATCTQLSKTIYTASYQGQEPEQQAIETGNELGAHEYEFVEFIWNANSPIAKVSLVCKTESSHTFEMPVELTSVQKTPATCTEKEVRTYTAKYGDHEETKDYAVGQPLGHSMAFSKFEWAANDESANAVLACQHDGCDHTENVAANMSSAVTQNANCENPEITRFTATYETNNDYKDKQTASALGHDYQYVRILWGEDKGEVVAFAQLVCNNDNNHKSNADVKLTSKVTDPTCVAFGYVTYTAEYYENEVLVGSDVKVVVDQAKTPTGIHTAGDPVKEHEVDPTCTEVGGYDMVTYCSVCKTSVMKSEHTVVAALGHHFVFDHTVDPTCVADGYDLYVCDRNGCDAEEHRNPVAATGNHTWDHERTCTQGHECTVCHAVEAALGHNFVVDHVTKATCTTPEYTDYVCSRDCGETNNDVVTSPALGHHYDEDHVEEVLQGGKDSCYYLKKYTCTNEGCNNVFIDNEKVIEHHHYVSTITAEATCTTAGVKTYTCSDCGKSYDEPLPIDPDKHVWLIGEVKDGVRTDTCSECEETREVTIYSGAASADTLKGKEIAVSNAEDAVDASMKIDDEILDNLAGKSVELGIAEVNKDSLELTPEQLAQVGDNTVYDFTMTADGDAVDFDGKKVTVTLPYPAEKVTNADSIAVWFIGNDGKLESIQAQYANGYVTFEADHFSRYTVTKLTPAEFCALYGHSLNLVQTFEGDCTHDAYTVDVCARCHEKFVNVTKKAPGHDWNVVTTDPTCTATGSEDYECIVCHETKSNTLPALGHDMHFDGYLWSGDYSSAKAVFVCGREGCDHVEYEVATVETEVKKATCTVAGSTTNTASYEEYDPESIVVSVTEPTGHTAGEVEHITSKEATCEEEGYHDDVIKCTVCQEVLSREVKVVDPALGHIWGEWELSEESSCTEDGIEIRYCTRDEEHFETRPHYATGHTPAEEAVIDEEAVVEATCTDNGSYDLVVYCTTCHQEISRETVEVPALGHSWGEWELVEEATCQDEGLEERVCANDEEHYETRPIPVIDHVPGEPVMQEGGTHATCDAQGHYFEYFYCIYCEQEIVELRNEVYEEALGHDYSVRFVLDDDPSTATVYFVCSRDEAHNFNTKVATTIVGEGPTCAEARNVTYRASITFNGKTYNSEDLIKENYRLEHVPGEATAINIVEATCSHEGGYDEVIYCEVCHQVVESEHVTVEKLPHTRGPIEIENEQAASCQEAGGYDEVIKCVECNEVLSTNHVTVPQLDHIPSGYLSNEDVHYHECTSCGNVLDYAEHDMVNTVTKEATCSENGVYHHECEVCGFEYDTMIPKTGIHHYVNGVCDMCGKAEKVCDHTELHDETLNVSEHGGCGGYITYKTCECGAVKYIDEYRFVPECNYYGNVRMEQREYMGETVQAQVMECPDCHMQYVMYNYGRTTDGCTTIINYPFLIVDPEGETILDAIYHYESTYHQHISYKTFNLDDSGENYIPYQYCSDCGQIIEVKNIVASDEVMEKMNVTRSKQVVDDMTVVESATYEYENVVIEFSTTTITEGCYITTRQSVIAYIDGEEAFNYVSGDKVEETHKWKYTYEIVDPELGCEGGVNMTRSCEKCGLAMHGKTYSHPYDARETATINFTQLSEGTCNGSFSYQVCGLCGEVDYIDLQDLIAGKYHAFDTTQGQPYEEGGIQYMPITYVCTNCGFTIEARSWQEVDGCETTINMSCKAYYDAENPVLDIARYVVYRNIDHNYEIQDLHFNDPEKGCEGGVTYKRVCTKCGDSYESSSSGHMYNGKSQEVRLIDDVTKEVLVTYYPSVCEICGETVISGVNINYECFKDYTPCEEVIDGVTYQGSIMTSPDQTLKFKALRANVKISPCEDSQNVYQELILVNEDGTEEVLYKRNDSYRNSHHTWEYNVVFNDEELGCDGGYTGERVCSICHETEEVKGSWHEYESGYVELSQYGACEGARIYKRECKICGKVDEHYFDWGRCEFKQDGERYYFSDHDPEHNHNHYSDVFVCSKCGLRRTVTVDSNNGYDDPCYSTYSETTVISIGEFTDTISRSSENYNHEYINTTYEPLGDDCQRYGYIIHRECSKCHKVFNETRYEHIMEETFTPRGDNCEEDGVEISYVCKICGYKEGKGHVEYSHIYGKDSRVRVNFSDYIPGQEGYIAYDVCSVCKDKSSYLETYVPGGMSVTSNDYVDKDGYKCHVQVTNGLQKDDQYLYRDTWLSRYIPVDACHTRVELTRQIFLNGNLIYENVDSEYDVFENHDLTYTYVFDNDENCEHGVTINAKCKNCNYSNSEHYDYHAQIINEKYDLSDYGCVCGGTFTVNSCPCGYEKSYDFDRECDFDYEYHSYYSGDEEVELPANVYERDVSSYTCAVTEPQCGFQYEEITDFTYQSANSCEVDLVTTFRLGTNTDRPLELTFVDHDYTTHHESKYSEEYDTIDEATGKYVVRNIDTCSRCGKQKVNSYEYIEGEYIQEKWSGGHIVKSTYEYWNGSKEIYEYDYVVVGEDYYQRTTAIENRHSDGGWSRTDYYYSEENPCNARAVHTSSYDKPYEEEVTRHLASRWRYYETSSCSQDCVEGQYCEVCGWHDDKQYVHALDHNFVWNEEEQIYICSRCGLENENGVSGSIIMEDLSDDYEYLYVVGYAFNTNVQFSKAVVISYEQDGQPKQYVCTDDEVDIMRWNEDYRPRAYYFSQEAARYVATEKLGLENGEYDISFVFYPYGDDSNFQYAITF